MTFEQIIKDRSKMLCMDFNDTLLVEVLSISAQSWDAETKKKDAVAYIEEQNAKGTITEKTKKYLLSILDGKAATL